MSFRDALCATRAGNLFTTHTPVAAGFDTFPPELIEKYVPLVGAYLGKLGISIDEGLALGRTHLSVTAPSRSTWRTWPCAAGDGGRREPTARAVSRRIFTGLYPRWPRWRFP